MPKVDAMGTVEVSRTLVRSPPELWTELTGEGLTGALAGRVVTPKEERSLEWEAEGARGTAELEPVGWGTRVTFRADVEERIPAVEPAVAALGCPTKAWVKL